MGSKIERQLLYYKQSKSEPETHYWNFLIINDLGNMRIIEQKLKDQLAPIIENRLIDEGEIQGSEKLHYKLFCLVSPTPSIKFSEVYQGKVRKDRVLQPRMTPNGWNDLIEKVYSGNI